MDPTTNDPAPPPAVREDCPALPILVAQLEAALKRFPENEDVVPTLEIAPGVPDTSRPDFNRRQDEAAERVIDLIGSAQAVVSALTRWLPQGREQLAECDRQIRGVVAAAQAAGLREPDGGTPEEVAEFSDAIRAVMEHVTGKPIPDAHHEATKAHMVARFAVAPDRPPAPVPPPVVAEPTLNLDPDKRAFAPFTPAEVKSFNDFQKACGDGFLHPFTCDGGEEGRYSDAHKAVAAQYHLPDFGALVAKPDGSGLHCPACGYTQEWCHGMMADDSWRAVKAQWDKDFGGLLPRPR